MTMWMNQNNQYLKERAMLVITRVLMFASKRAKKYNVGQILLPNLLTDFVFTLLKKLSSSDTDIVCEAASLLKLTLDYHAQKITMVSKIVDDIYEQLSVDSSHAMKAVFLRVISLLTKASPKKVIFQLLEFPVPADDALLLMWQAVSTESSVAFQVLKTILSVLKGKPGEVEGTLVERRRFSLDATNMMPVAASQALCTFLPVNSYRKVVAKLFPEFLMALMLQLFYCSQLLKDTGQDRPLYVRDGLKVLLNCSGLKEVDEALEKKNFWDQFSQVMDHQYGIHLIAKTLSECNFPQFPETLHYVYKIAIKDPRRSEDTIVTIIFFAEIENVSNLLLPVLDAFLSKEHTVIIRAMLTLRNILSKLDKTNYSTVCTKIASSYCPLMDHVNGGVQCMAIRHFGELLRDMSEYKWMLNHIILGSLVPLILFLESTETRIMNLSSYERYIIDLISDTLGFLGSSRAFLKKGSIILVGYLGKSGEHLLLKEEIDVMIEVVERATREEDPVIKMLAAKTHKLFKDIAYRIASSTIKQTLRRWAKVFHTKKLKPIYDLANSIGLMEYTAEEVIEMKAKESLYELTATSSRLQKKEFFVD
ncbi:maestro heat-like repeat family member 9 [Cricetulus griseus]